MVCFHLEISFWEGGGGEQDSLGGIGQFGGNRTVWGEQDSLGGTGQFGGNRTVWGEQDSLGGTGQFGEQLLMLLLLWGAVLLKLDSLGKTRWFGGNWTVLGRGNCPDSLRVGEEEQAPPPHPMKP